MQPGLLKTLAAATAITAGALCMTRCGNDDGPVPTVKAPPGATGPTTAEVLAQHVAPGSAVAASQLEAVPSLGAAVVWKAPDGVLWQRYASGILMEDLMPGTGPMPKVGQTVAVSYVGTLPGSNKEFDRSPKDKPLQFILGKKAGTEMSVIKGWNLAVSTMRVGARRRVLIPPDLAYGERGSPPKIAANQALIFEMELVSITGEPVELPSTTQPATQTGIEAIDALKSAPVGPPPPSTAPTKKRE